jgi:hypothetical protein
VRLFKLVLHAKKAETGTVDYTLTVLPVGKNST